MTYHHPRFCTVGDTLTRAEREREERDEAIVDLDTALENFRKFRKSLSRVDATDYLDDRLDAIEIEVAAVRDAL